MALFLEDSQKVTRRKAPVPLKDRQYYSAWYNALEKIMPKNNLKNLKSLASTKNYNKKGDDNLNGKEQNASYVSVEDAKKRMQRMNPNDISQGGQKAYNFYKKTIERARSQAEVSPIEPPKPTASVKPSNVNITKQSTPTAKIKSEEVERNDKKVYMTEESIKRLCEYYTQLNIPFNDPSKPYDDKQNYEHFIDWLEYVGKYGQLPPSKADVSELVRAAFKDGFQYYLYDDLEDDNFIYNARSAMNDLFNECDGDEDYLRLYFNLPEEWYTNPPDNITDYLEEMGWDNDVIEMENVLTDEGGEKFNSKMEDYFQRKP